MKHAKAPPNPATSTLGRQGYHAPVPKFQLKKSPQQEQLESAKHKKPRQRRTPLHAKAPAQLPGITEPGDALLNAWEEASAHIVEPQDMTRDWAEEGGMLGGFRAGNALRPSLLTRAAVASSKASRKADPFEPENDD